MNPDSIGEMGFEPFAGRRTVGEARLGVLGSVLLHGLAALAIFLFIVKNTGQQPPPPAFHVVPIDLIRLGAETASPDLTQKALVPQQRAPRTQKQEAASPTPEAISPRGKKPAPVDVLDAKLRALARLRQPDTKLRLDNSPGVSNVDAGNGVPGDQATYSVRDYVRAQIERRWIFNIAHLGGRKFVIPIRVVMKRDGTIVSAEIVELARTKTDVIYRDIALSARNAALLSSPIPMPPGDFPKTMTFTLPLDPRDTLR